MAQNNIFPTLKFSKDATKNEYLNKSIKIAEIFLENLLCRSTFTLFNVNAATCVDKIQKVKVDFMDVKGIKLEDLNGKKREKNLIAGWTYRRSNAKIHINNLFEKRLKMDSLDEKERKIIIIYIGIVILHEVGHLVFRWNGITETPEKFKMGGTLDAGDFLEVHIFTSRISIIIQNDPKNKDWDENMPIIGNFIFFVNKKM